ncbi:hypothetical protein JS756_00485 [Streptomyces actuosus]|uniref:Uncharacterized protein n=1 Tax=Streptomyces actuosus TaxID=1885 RepID=A0ABS2VHQ0_STRAS|nr:hypothetical protein [Streptomyces actuosus]MBN0042611.1 hypothetical protein [Streptomyces actuosus]
MGWVAVSLLPLVSLLLLVADRIEDRLFPPPAAREQRGRDERRRLRPVRDRGARARGAQDRPAA